MVTPKDLFTGLKTPLDRNPENLAMDNKLVNHLYVDPQ